MIEVGQTIGNYKITAKLGEGGMGVVYLAEHPVIGRKVALKAIHPELSRNPEVVSRFMTEAKSVNQIGNEHIVDVSDFGNTGEGEFYFIMEFLQGEALSDRLRREHLFEANRALQIGAQVADALAASHNHGIIHRDLKPENIFLITRGSSRDFVKVLDFGLAKLTQGEEKVSHKTRTGSVMGTPYYMSPEQCEGRANIDHRADVYSLGVILFEMMTGKVPFGGEGYGEIIVKHITLPPPSPRAINPAITPAQEAVLMYALGKRRDQRFQTMDEFRMAMLNPEQFAAGNPAILTDPGPQHSPYEPSGHVQVPYGSERPTAVEGAAKVAPMPSTFRHGVGELLDEEVAVPRSRKGLVVGALLAAAVAGTAAFFLMRRGGGDGDGQQPAVAAPAPTPPAPPAPVLPEKVKISFSSEPVGADVVSKETGVTLGKTPFAFELKYGKGPVAFIFRKENYEDKEMSLVPEMAALLNATLVTKRVVETPPPPTPVKPQKAVSGRPKAKSTPAKPKKGSNKPLDEDGVLEPSFR